MSYNNNMKSLKTCFKSTNILKGSRWNCYHYSWTGVVTCIPPNSGISFPLPDPLLIPFSSQGLFNNILWFSVFFFLYHILPLLFCLLFCCLHTVLSFPFSTLSSFFLIPLTIGHDIELKFFFFLKRWREWIKVCAFWSIWKVDELNNFLKVKLQLLTQTLS